jgi:hypothetical protein
LARPESFFKLNSRGPDIAFVSIAKKDWGECDVSMEHWFLSFFNKFFHSFELSYGGGDVIVEPAFIE